MSQATESAFAREWARIAVRVDTLDKALRERANALAHGLGDGRNVWHNALIARECGQPWPGVDYANLRRAMYVDTVLRSKLYRLRGALFLAMSARYRHGSACCKRWIGPAGLCSQCGTRARTAVSLAA